MHLVGLARWVGHADDRIGGTPRYREPARWYAKPAELPLPPSVGIHLMIHPDNDPEIIEKVIVTTEGAIVCTLPQEYCEGPLDLLDEDWPSYRDWLTEGWVYLGDGFPHYRLGKPAAARTDG